MDLFDQDILAFDPWFFEDRCDRVLQDQFQATRRDHVCAWCAGTIVAGSRVRARSEVYRSDKIARTYRFCANCCEAMGNAARHGLNNAYLARRNPQPEALQRREERN